MWGQGSNSCTDVTAAAPGVSSQLWVPAVELKPRGNEAELGKGWTCWTRQLLKPERRLGPNPRRSSARVLLSARRRDADLEQRRYSGPLLPEHRERWGQLPSRHPPPPPPLSDPCSRLDQCRSARWEIPHPAARKSPIQRSRPASWARLFESQSFTTPRRISGDKVNIWRNSSIHILLPAGLHT